MTYEPPTIEERVEVGAALVGVAASPIGISPAWRRTKDEQEETPVTYEAPAIEERAEVGGPLIGAPVGSPVFSPAWRRTEHEQEQTP